jgi:hypothetical protein
VTIHIGNDECHATLKRVAGLWTLDLGPGYLLTATAARAAAIKIKAATPVEVAALTCAGFLDCKPD